MRFQFILYSVEVICFPKRLTLSHQCALKSLMLVLLTTLLELKVVSFIEVKFRSCMLN